MIKYRTKTSILETILVKDAIHCAANDWKSLPKWLTEAYDRGNVIFTPKKLLLQKDPYFAQKNEWIEVDSEGILTYDEKGHLNNYNVDIFHNYYEKVEE